MGAAVSILWSPVILAPYAPPLFLNFSSQPANDLRKFNSKLRTESTFSRYSNCTRAKFKESLWPRRFKVTFNEKYKGSWKRIYGPGFTFDFQFYLGRGGGGIGKRRERFRSCGARSSSSATIS